MEAFKKHIEAYIQGQIEADPMFADIYNKSERSIEDCITFLLNWVKAGGMQIVAKEEIYGQVIHFYTENLDPGAKLSAHVVCATRAELTEEEKEEARQEALKQYQKEELAKLQAKNQPKPKAVTAKPQQPQAVQATLSLFDFED